MKLIAGTALAVILSSTHAFAAGECATGKTLTDGTLTIATGNPAYYPWVMNDAPESGEGFEAAVAYAIAEKMGFANTDTVKSKKYQCFKKLQSMVKDNYSKEDFF